MLKKKKRGKLTFSNFWWILAHLPTSQGRGLLRWLGGVSSTLHPPLPAPLLSLPPRCGRQWLGLELGALELVASELGAWSLGLRILSYIQYIYIYICFFCFSYLFGYNSICLFLCLFYSFVCSCICLFVCFLFNFNFEFLCSFVLLFIFYRTDTDSNR